MKKTILISLIVLFSPQIFAEISLPNKINEKNLAFKVGYASINIDNNLLGSETVNSIEYSTTYDFNRWGIWAKYEHQKIIRLESDQYAIGGQYTFYKNHNFYALTAFGIGLTDISYKKKKYQTYADYVYYPLNIEVGYMFYPNIGAYATWGYKWYKNQNTQIYYKGIKVLDDSYNELDLHGQTYSIGLRAAF